MDVHPSYSRQEMLRIKRSVQAQYNTDVGYVAASAQGAAPVDSAVVVAEGDAMAALEQNAPLPGFIESSTGPVGGGGPVEEKKEDMPVDSSATDNPDAIELGDDDEMETG